MERWLIRLYGGCVVAGVLCGAGGAGQWAGLAIIAAGVFGVGIMSHRTFEIVDYHRGIVRRCPRCDWPAPPARPAPCVVNPDCTIRFP